MAYRGRVWWSALFLIVSATGLVAQTRPRPAAAGPQISASSPVPTKPASVEKLPDGRLRVGGVTVNLKTRELSVPGVINAVPVLEFLVNTKGGYKAYESAIEAEANAIDFNLGLILIGLDREHATNRPRFHFDPLPPGGDRVELWVAWNTPSGEKRVRAEELVWDETSKTTMPPGTWVYTGSRFVERSTAFLADVDGVLVGFVHTPAPLIERTEPVLAYGSVMVNPNLGLAPGSPVTFIVRAVDKPSR